jgi:hypothetical protein
MYTEYNRCFFLDPYKAYEWTSWAESTMFMLNLVGHKVTSGT